MAGRVRVEVTRVDTDPDVSKPVEYAAADDAQVVVSLSPGTYAYWGAPEKFVCRIPTGDDPDEVTA